MEMSAGVVYCGPVQGYYDQGSREGAYAAPIDMGLLDMDFLRLLFCILLIVIFVPVHVCVGFYCLLFNRKVGGFHKE